MSVYEPAGTGRSITTAGSVAIGKGGYFLGNVGIGIPAPSTNLHIYGNTANTHVIENIQNAGAGGYASILYLSSTRTFGIASEGAASGIDGNGNLEIFDASPGGGHRFVIMSNGYVGIGTWTPGALFQVGNSGDGSVAKANSWSTFSDIRLKRDLTKIPNASEIVDGLNGYYYYWKDGKDQSRQVGVVAQEVEKVLPEVVHTGSDGIKTVDYPKLTAVLIEAYKEMEAKNASLETRVEELESKPR
jgi:hypothetical protein